MNTFSFWLKWMTWVAMFPDGIKASVLPVFAAKELDDGEAAALSVARSFPSCSVVVLREEDIAHKDSGALEKGLSKLTTFQGTTMLSVSKGNNRNETIKGEILQIARKVRLSFPCTTMIILSDNLSFIKSFAEASVANRLLTKSSKLVLTMTSRTLRNLQEVKDGMIHQWALSMLDTLLLIPSFQDHKRWEMFSCLPFSEVGRHVVKVATWNKLNDLTLESKRHSLLPDKFSNFHGASINVTALPYKPYWTIKKTEDGVVSYSGTDRHMLEAMSNALNFSIYVLPVKSWDEVLQRVSDRTSMIACVVHMILPQRLERVDFARTYEHGINIAFAMAKPVLKPQWQSLYYPLTSQVWFSILAVLLIAPLCFKGVIRWSRKSGQVQENKSWGLVSMEVFGTLLGQAVNTKLPPSDAARMLLAFWLIFAFVICTGYRGNLIASLVAPRYPARPESLDQLVQVAESVTMPPYGAEFRDYLRKSEFESFRALGAMLKVGVSVTEGLNQALKHRQSHIDGTRYLMQQIAEFFTEADGSSKLYVGREGVLPGLNAYPIPHDAPYKESFGSVIIAAIEGGLYNKWMADMLDEARKEGRQKRREQLKEALQEGNYDESKSSSSDGDVRPLTIVHLQGPLMLLVLGMAAGAIVFSAEVVLKLCVSK